MKCDIMNGRLIVFFISLIFSSVVYAFKIDTISVYSTCMNRSLDVLVVSPEKAKLSECPVLFLLHGYGGNEETWLKINPKITEMSDRDGIIVVCPNGEKSWYWDSPINPESQFETYITKELLPYIDSNYNTIKNRNARAITGLSMGGHGALWLSLRHKDLFGAAGSTSGGVDIRPFPDNWDMKQQIGNKNENPSIWDKYTVINQLDSINNADLSIIFDCGTDDFFFDVNNNLHSELLKRNIDHDYIVRPGGHNNNYWCNSIEYQWLYFSKFFRGYRFIR